MSSLRFANQLTQLQSQCTRQRVSNLNPHADLAEFDGAKVNLLFALSVYQQFTQVVDVPCGKRGAVVVLAEQCSALGTAGVSARMTCGGGV